jgi:hypothetical protein
MLFLWLRSRRTPEKVEQDYADEVKASGPRSGEVRHYSRKAVTLVGGHLCPARALSHVMAIPVADRRGL